jgi:hypothetical protein
MLDLPELLERVFQLLNPHDLTRCAQVNKQWHALVIPHLWRDLTCVCSGDARRRVFGRIVLEDYLQENGYVKGPSQPTALSKYGHLIRLLPGPMDLESALHSQGFHRQCTAHDLLLHIFKRSSKAQVNSLHHKLVEFESDKSKSVLAFTLPRLRRLNIRGSLQGHPWLFNFKSVLDQCSTTLECLDVDIDIPPSDQAIDMKDEATGNESVGWTSLKNLILRHSADTWDAGPFWTWMCKRCSQVESLVVRRINKSTPGLVQAMLTHMPNLRGIAMGDFNISEFFRNREDEMEDDVIAALLSGSRHGWKSVSVKTTAKLGPKSVNALAMHYSTLEEFYIDGNNDVPSSDLVQILRSCPHLHTFCYTNMTNGSSAVYGEAFIDLDPDTGLLMPWLCEGSLKMLDIKIAGIQRPDLDMCALVEAYPGQGREIQSQLYDRLGRLTHLETLRLGDGFGGSQYDCLEMSLESGLDKLSGLKSLKKLNVGRLETKIGINEVQWMVENWPELSIVGGLGVHRWDMEAVEWLRKNCPKISVMRKLYCSYSM